MPIFPVDVEVSAEPQLRILVRDDLGLAFASRSFEPVWFQCQCV